MFLKEFVNLCFPRELTSVILWLQLGRDLMCFVLLLMCFTLHLRFENRSYAVSGDWFPASDGGDKFEYDLAVNARLLPISSHPLLESFVMQQHIQSGKYVFQIIAGYLIKKRKPHQKEDQNCQWNVVIHSDTKSDNWWKNTCILVVLGSCVGAT